MAITVEITESDFREVATDKEKEKIFGKTRVLGGDADERGTEEIIEDLLPSALVQRVRKMIPKDFELVEISMQAEVSGKVLGSGLSGTFEMKLAKLP